MRQECCGAVDRLDLQLTATILTAQQKKANQSFKRYNPSKLFWEGSKKFDARENTKFWLIWRLLNTYWILMVNDVLGVLMRRHRYLPAFSRLEAMPRPSPMKSCWRTKSQLDSFKVLFCIAEFEFCSFGRCSHCETLWSQDPSTKEFYDVFRFLISQLELQSRDLWSFDCKLAASMACKLCQEMTIRFFSLILIQLMA